MNKDWKYKKNIDGLELIINYKNGKYYSEVIFEGNTIYSDNEGNKETLNILSETFKSMTPDEIFTYYKIFICKGLNLLKYIIDNMTEIGQQTEGNTLSVYGLANNSFSNIKIFIEKYTLEPLGIYKTEKKNGVKPNILQDLIDAGQLNKDVEKNGKYKPFKSTTDFIDWCIYNKYIDENKKGIDDLTPEFFDKYIETGCNKDTIKKYFERAKK
jgi:hypothetical protein